MKIFLSRSIKTYEDAVKNAGAEIGDSLSNGLILCGGGDISPSFYNEENTSAHNVDYNLDLYEFDLLKKYVALKKPVLGICRGMQIINVFFGGSLYQHIENHKSNDGDIFHPIIYNNKEFIVNSCHHQAVKNLGDSIIPTAFSLDGTIEAIKHKILPVYGVQFHPERMADGLRIFDFFVDICSV